MGTRIIKSNLPGAGWRRRLDGAEPLFCSCGVKCKRVPSGVPIKDALDDTSTASFVLMAYEETWTIKSNLLGVAWSPPTGRRQDIAILRSKIDRVFFSGAVYKNGMVLSKKCAGAGGWQLIILGILGKIRVYIWKNWKKNRFRMLCMADERAKVWI